MIDFYWTIGPPPDFNRFANTFMKLLMRMLTPAMFIRKFPDFWRRDMSSGNVSIFDDDLEKKRFSIHVTDVEGFDYLGPVGVGYLGYVLDRILGHDSTKLNLLDFEFQNPGPAEFTYRVSW